MTPATARHAPAAAVLAAPAVLLAPAARPAPEPLPQGAPIYVRVDPLEDVLMPGRLKLAMVLGLLALVVMGSWAAFYVLVWSQGKLAS